ncbi:MAG: DUF4129 domain-containing protein [Candidatus Adiutricales bacterium]
MNANKNWILIALAVVAVSVLILSASIPSLELKPGHRLIMSRDRVLEDTGLEKNGSKQPLDQILNAALRATFFVLGIAIPLLLIYGLRYPDIRRRYLRVLVFGVIIFTIANYLKERKFSIKIPTGDFGFKVGEKFSTTAEEYIPDPPQWLVLITSLLLSALVLGIGVYLWRRLRNLSSPLEQVAQEAQKTIDEIRSGTDLKEGVIRCYYEMARVLSEERGIKRRQAMTTREFEKQLEEAGLTSGHVSRLTRLFEQVRYGSKHLGDREEREALDCLTAIVEASKESS